MSRLLDCKRDNLCVDCDKEDCLHHGKIMPDCPKYDCDNEPLYDCENCEFIKQYQQDYREKQKKENIYIKFASHAIGLDNKKPYKRRGKLFYRPYRNYYCASQKDSEIWDVMVNAGYAKAGKKDRRGGRTYWLTRKGLDWLGERLNIKIYDEEE